MPLISFSVFKDKILSGEKLQTIRELRKYPIKPGDTLYLWWKSRTPEREFLGEAICTEVLPVEILGSSLTVDGNLIDSLEEKTKFAKDDGFESFSDFLKFFKAETKRQRVLIKWDEILQNRIHD
ncbi:hypothetical protein [Microcoleus sp. FACHB-672]|uniref:hypothetical protein n=1 Tax=Microcoleus sp. FACHB-672 TaxID=2692825 RepID=UPI0016838ABD|nr:hypothetical protein [Microcoleus sp. FACHB-672]MBD2039221.1 hypothetical protein [Microcoleus sp. FACHB-672]